MIEFNNREWKKTTLGNTGYFTRGKGIKKTDVSDTGVFCIRYGEIYTKYDFFVENPLSKIPPNIAKQSKLIKKGDLLFSSSGETPEGIGKCVAYLGDKACYAGGDIIILSPTRDDPLFLAYVLNSEKVRKQKTNMAQGDMVVHIYKSNLEKIEFSIPDVTEQQKITNLLSNTDALIKQLDYLITKKKNIKQGAIQEFLTGKRRLEGFKDSWITEDLPTVCWFQEGPGLRNWQFKTKGMKVINVTNLVKGFLDLDKTKRHISINEFNKMYKHFEIDEKDILIASSGNSYAKVAVVRKKDLPLVMNTSVIRFKPLNNFDYNFLLEFLKSSNFKNQIDFLITGGAQPNFGPAHLDQIKIKLPPTKNEQVVIGQMLYDMDTEIKELETKRDKYIMIKNGMMQKLLTGEIRLV